MPYASGRVYHDADAHIMEPADWLVEHADPAFRDRMPRFRIGGIGQGRRPGGLGGPHLPAPPRRGLPGRGVPGHPAQELLRRGRLRTRPPQPGARPAGLRQPTDLHHVLGRRAGGGRSGRRRGAGLRHGRRPQPGGHPLLLGRPPPAGRGLRVPDGPRPGRRPGRPGHRGRLPGPDDRLAVPEGSLTVPHRARPGLGPGGRGPGADRHARGWAAARCCRPSTS